jgi:membrane associated rhomboid family serine protease
MGHDRPLRRIPAVTLAIVLVSLLVQFEQCSRAPSLAEVQSAEAGVTFVERKILDQYWASVTIGATFGTTSSDRVDDTAPFDVPRTASGDVERRPAVILANFRAGQYAPAWHHYRDELKQAEAVVERLKRREFVDRFAYRPSSGASTNVVASAFVHRGWLEFAGCMLFAWMLGVCLEDRLGHAAFAALFFAGAAVGATSHAIAHAGSDAALLGASAVIAAALGAFLLRFRRGRVRIFYWSFWSSSFFGSDVGYVPALVVLPAWAIVAGATAWFEPNADTRAASWVAQLGAFVFGGGAALLARVTGLEAKLAPEDDDEAADERKREEPRPIVREPANTPALAIAPPRPDPFAMPPELPAAAASIGSAFDVSDESVGARALAPELHGARTIDDAPLPIVLRAPPRSAASSAHSATVETSLAFVPTATTAEAFDPSREAEAARDALAAAGFLVDFTPTSLTALDAWIARSLPRPLDPGSFEASFLVRRLGAYLGEIVARAHGGAFRVDEAAPASTCVALPNGGRFSPYVWIERALADESPEPLAAKYARIFGRARAPEVDAETLVGAARAALAKGDPEGALALAGRAQRLSPSTA